MSISPSPGIVAFSSFQPPTSTDDGVRGYVPQPLAGQQTYILSASGWVAAGGGGGGTVTSVDATVPAFLSVSGVPITTSGTIAITYSGTALPVANGGTGVTASTGANSVVLRDANQNVTANAFDDAYVNTVASGTQITLTVASARRYTITGSGGQVIKLPDATTLVNGTIFEFDNNQSSGAITVNNNSNTLVVSVPSGGIVRVNLLSNATAAGSWDRHDLTPSNVSWSTNTLDYAGSITSATWNGNVIAYNRGGTGQSSVFAAGGIVYGSTTTVMAVTAAGTSGQVLTSAGASAPAFSSNIDGVTIGGTTAAAGTFTTLTGTTSTTTPIVQNSAAAAIAFKTNSATSAVTQFNINHTATAVNYVQVAGAATGGNPAITAQGSDAAINLVLSSKSTSSIYFYTNNVSTNSRHLDIIHTGTVVNRFQITGSQTGNPVVLGVNGNDANIDITLTPKGTGRVNITTSIKPKVNSAANVTSPLAWDSTSYDEYAITALANALTINADANASPADGQRMMFRFKDNGTARALTWTTGSTNSFRVVGVTLPTTTVASKLVYIGCVYNAADSRWDAVAVSQEA